MSAPEFHRLSEKLKHIRETLGYTQEQMAQILGYDVSDIKEFESGTPPADYPLLGRFRSYGWFPLHAYTDNVSIEGLPEDKREALVALLSKGLLATCPECDAEIRLCPDDDLGDTIECDECRSEWELTSLDPTELDLIDIDDYGDDDSEDEEGDDGSAEGFFG